MAEDKEGIFFILDFFKDRESGYLIDVGAHEGVAYGSMSYELLQKGWSGILIEPLPTAYRQLEINYRGNNKIICVEAACSIEDGIGNLYPCQGVSTLDPNWAQACSNWWSHVQYGERIPVKKFRLDTLLNLHSAPLHVDFLQIDTEGHDLMVLKGMDWRRSPDLICVETLDMNHIENKQPDGKWLPNIDMNEYLKSIGYTCCFLTPGGNGFYVRKN